MTIFPENVAVNTRCLSAAITGVQRYTAEITKQLPGCRPIAPNRHLDGLAAHAWEQSVLPIRTRGSLLWSPATTGPLSVQSQVVTIHDVSFIDHPEWFNKKFAVWYGWLVPRLAKRVSHIITDASYTKDRILELTGISAEKVTVIPIGVDVRFSPTAADTAESVRKLLGIPTSRYVLSLSSLEPRKNLARMLDAWRIAAGKLPKDVWLVLAGAQGKSSVFRDAGIESLPERVFLSGYVPDDLLPGLLSGATAFVYPSLYEGFGLPPLEAMACGTPVLTGNTTSLPEVIGDAGIMVDPKDTDAIADGIVRLIEDSDLSERLVKRGMDKARQYTWADAASRTAEVLRRALNGI